MIYIMFLIIKDVSDLYYLYQQNLMIHSIKTTNRIHYFVIVKKTTCAKRSILTHFGGNNNNALRKVQL